MRYPDLAARVEQVLHQHGDADALFELMEREIDSAPQDASLYSLRARLNDACAYRSPAWRDLQQAAALAPGDREAALAVVAYQCRHAVRIAWSLSDDDDDDAVDARGAQLEDQAVAGMWRLMRDYAGDAAFALRILGAFDDSGVSRPCDNYGLVLTALAAHPADRALRKKEALVLSWLATIGPDTDNIPIGYYEDWFGNRLHAAGVERALAAIDALLAECEDTDLMAEKAGLLTGQEQLAQAAALYARLAIIYEEQLARAAPAEREALSERLENARREHANCAGGTSSYLAGQESLLASALDQVANMTGAARAAQLRADAETWRREAAAQKQGPDAKMKAELDRVAADMAGHVVGLLAEPPVLLRAQDPAGDAKGVAPWFAELAPGLKAAGLPAPVGFENPNYTGRFGSHQGRLWAHPDGRLALVAEAVPGNRLVRVISRLSDGSILVTGASLGSDLFSAGPRVESVTLMKDTPVPDMVALHAALLARRLAAAPGLSALPVRTLAELAQAENEMLALKQEFRRRVGVADVEIRGMPVRHPAYFAKVLRAEVAMRLAALGRDKTP